MHPGRTADAGLALIVLPFDGGGAYYDNDTDFTGWLGAEFGNAIKECQDKTDAVGVLFAYDKG